jgi:sensor c-di-GMP phosphodiesterase-like protein
MYRAKQLGRNNYQFYTPEMNAQVFERLAPEIRLRTALEREEFVLHYQPQVDLKTGQITGAEVLLRWRHPDLGLVAPTGFMHVLEESGLIVT